MLLFILNSCNEVSCEIQLNKIKQICGKQEDCVFELSDVTSFAWDTLYVFNVRATPSEVERVTNGRGKWRDLANQHIFLKNGIVVKQVYHYYNPEFPEKLSFDLCGYNYGVFKPNDKFVLKKIYPDEEIYTLFKFR